jgi:hypothetical protein
MDKGTAVSGIADEAADRGVIAGHLMYDEKRHGQKQRNENNCLYTKHLTPLMSNEHNRPFPYKNSSKIMSIDFKVCHKADKIFPCVLVSGGDETPENPVLPVFPLMAIFTLR